MKISKEQNTVKAMVTTPVSVKKNLATVTATTPVSVTKFGNVIKPNNVAVRRNGFRNRSRFLLYVLCSILLALGSILFTVQGYAAQADMKERIALFPFENLSDDRNALKSVMPLLRERLEAKGFDILDDDILDKFLLKERIRCTGYITKDIAGKLMRELNIKAVMVGSINTFAPEENPRIGFSARLVNSSDGAIIWASHVSATGEDFMTILGLGRITSIDELACKVADKLLESFRLDPLQKETESTYKIAVMPFENKTRTKDAGMIATYMFIVDLFRNKNFVPVEFGEIKCLIIDLQIREKGEIDLKKAKAILKSARVDGIIIGTVEGYKEEEGTAPSEVGISARLIDARRDKILWCNCSQLQGDDEILILDWGRKRSAECVAYKAVSNMVEEMSKVKWQ
jgi:TolB-like protein